MSVGVILLCAVIASMVACLVLLVSLLLKHETWNLHDLWPLALNGDRGARIYLVLSASTFAGAVASALLIRAGI